MEALYLKYNETKFWENYWEEFQVDYEEFTDLNIYPIDITLNNIQKSDRILECGFGGGRVIRHLHKNGFNIE